MNSRANFFTDILSSFSTDRGREVDTDVKVRREGVSYRDAPWFFPGTVN